MNSGKQFKISLILVCLLFTSVLSILLVIAPSSTVVANGADNNIIIMRAKDTAYNLDAEEEDPVPWAWYGTQNENKPNYVGNRPPIMAAKRVENGAVVAGGTVATCRNTRWNGYNNMYPYLDDLLDCAFQWMVENAENVLWYGEHVDHGGPGPSIENTVYNDALECSQLIAALEGKGYSVDNTIDGADTPITPGLLDPYNILVIPQLQAGERFTGGDPSLLPDSWVDAIVNFVKGGGGLLIMEGADFGGHNYLYVHNKILDALEFPLHFQSDQVNDPNNNWYAPYAPYFEVCSDTEIGSCYETKTGDNEIGMWSLCSLAPPGRWVSVSISPIGRAGENGETLTYTVKIINGGDNDDNFSLEATNDGGWEVSVDPENVFVKGKENENTATLRVTIPDNADPGDNTHTTVTATSLTDNTVSGSGRTGTERWIKPKFGEWTVASSLFPYTPGYGITVAGAGENIYITNTSSFLRYNTITGVWESLEAPDVFMNGCCLYWGGGNYIYAIVGASYPMCKEPAERNYKFYRYDIPNNNWIRLADTPWYQGPGDALTWVKMGDNEYLYAFLGTSSRSGNPNGWYYYPEGVQFWSYNIAEDNWDENLTPNPYGADDGASLAWTGGDYIYAFPGAYDEGLPVENERFFLRYSISGDNWVEMEKTPYNAPVGGVDDGGSLAYPGSGDYIYALKGGNDGGSTPGDNFWRYSIPNDNWEILDHIPAGVGDNNGRRLGVANGNIYCWRGSYGDGTLWVYSLSGRDVEVSISPDYISGMPGATLEFTVTVTNTGTENDNYKLENTDTEGWTLELSKNLLTNIAPGENENVTLTVTIPEDAEYCTEDKITVTAISLVDPRMSDRDSCIAHQGYFIKENMPDLGQHCENWCWTAAAANSIWWYATHGYPQLIDNLENAESDNEWIDQWYTCPVCGKYRKLLAVIASHCLGLPPEDTLCHPVNDVQYLYGLREFMETQGAPLFVHEIVNPTHFPPENIPPPDEKGVVYDNVAFEDYKRELLRCQDVLLWLDLDYEPFDHVVTGVSFFENQWIEVSDPWSTGMPDHNNDNENRQYDNCTVISEVPFRITVPSYGQPATVVKMVYISPTLWIGTATFELDNMYKVSLEKDLWLYTGKKLVVKFYKYDNALQDNSVIDNFTTPPYPYSIKENENVPHPLGAPVPPPKYPGGTVQIARLVLTTDDTANEISTIASFTVHQSDLKNRFIEILGEWFPNPDKHDAFRAEVKDILSQWFAAPP